MKSENGEFSAVKNLISDYKYQYVEFNYIREVSALRSLHNKPHIIEMLGYNIEDSQIYLEYTAGGSLKGVLKSTKPYWWKTDDARRKLFEIVRGMSIINGMGIWHRDLKPDNILVTSDGKIKITDFGGARGGPFDWIPITSMVHTQFWRAPEILIGNIAGWKPRVNYDGVKSDIYSIGVIFWEILASNQSDDELRKKAFNAIIGDYESDQLLKIMRIFGLQTFNMCGNYLKAPMDKNKCKQELLSSIKEEFKKIALMDKREQLEKNRIAKIKKEYERIDNIKQQDIEKEIRTEQFKTKNLEKISNYTSNFNYDDLNKSNVSDKSDVSEVYDDDESYMLGVPGSQHTRMTEYKEEEKSISGGGGTDEWIAFADDMFSDTYIHNNIHKNIRRYLGDIPDDAIELLISMIHPNPEKRSEYDDIMKSSYFDSIRDEYKPLIIETVKDLQVGKCPCVIASNDISIKMYTVLTFWLNQVKNKFKLTNQVCYLATQILRCHLSRDETITTKNLQLAGIAAMTIANGYMEEYPVEYMDFIYVTDNTYTEEQLHEYIKKLILNIGGQLHLGTSYYFLLEIMKNNNLTKGQFDEILKILLILDISPISFEKSSLEIAELAYEWWSDPKKIVKYISDNKSFVKFMELVTKRGIESKNHNHINDFIKIYQSESNE